MIKDFADSVWDYNDKTWVKRQNKKMLNYVSHKKHFV